MSKEKPNAKQSAIDNLTNYLTYLENRGDQESKSKISKLSYWLETYFQYLKREETFEPKKLKRYERGDIINVNLGYNVGSEEGGLHYAIVLDKNNSISSPILNIIPLTSVKNDEKEVSKYDVMLGDEIYRKLISKFDKMYDKCKRDHDILTDKTESLDLAQSMIEELIDKIKSDVDIQKVKEYLINLDISKLDKTIVDVYRRYNINDIVSIEDAFDIVVSIFNANKIFLDKWTDDLDYATKQLQNLEKVSKEIGKMKQGSIALVGQITTISKLRIYDPRNKYSVLSGIKISSDSLDKIDAKIKELFIRE